MNCEYWEKQIALHVEGDVSLRKSRQVEKHLNTCPGCQQFARELSQSQAVLKSLGHEAVDGRVFEAIQNQVMNKLDLDKTSASRTLWRSILWNWRSVGVMGLLLLVGGTGAIWEIRSSRQTSFGTADSNKPIETPAKGKLAARATESQAENHASDEYKSLLAPLHHARPHQIKLSEQHSQTSNSTFPGAKAAQPNESWEASIPEPPQLPPMKSFPFEQGVPGGNQMDESSEGPEHEQLTIKLVTDDPEVVIVWLVGADRGKTQ